MFVDACLIHQNWSQALNVAGLKPALVSVETIQAWVLLRPLLGFLRWWIVAAPKLKLWKMRRHFRETCMSDIRSLPAGWVAARVEVHDLWYTLHI